MYAVVLIPVTLISYTYKKGLHTFLDIQTFITYSTFAASAFEMYLIKESLQPEIVVQPEF